MYVYTFFAIGELPAFVIGWALVSIPLVAMAYTAKVFSAVIDFITGGAITTFEVFPKLITKNLQVERAK